MRRLLGFFLSLGTTMWTLAAVLIVLLCGSFVMAARPEFQGLLTTPLFTWMAEAPIGITWWLWAAIGGLVLLAANTVFCSIEALIRKRKGRQWLLVVSPQVIHLGFLLILLAHLLSSLGGFKGMAMTSQGAALDLPNGLTVVFDRINADTDPAGYVTDWSAEVRYFRAGQFVARDRIAPNSPSFRDGLGTYIKTVRLQQVPVALVEVSGEPGALWALAGAILFLIGTISLLFLKMRREEAVVQSTLG
jgi:hypothetical protein